MLDIFIHTYERPPSFSAPLPSVLPIVADPSASVVAPCLAPSQTQAKSKGVSFHRHPVRLIAKSGPLFQRKQGANGARKGCELQYDSVIPSNAIIRVRTTKQLSLDKPKIQQYEQHAITRPYINLNTVCRWFVAGLLHLSSLGAVLLLAHYQNLKLVLDGVASLSWSRFAHIHYRPPPPVRLAASGWCAGCILLTVFV